MDVIELTRLNGQKLYLNCDMLKSAETAPDTVLTLVTGDKIVVRESCAEIVALALAWRVGVLRAAWPDAAGALTALPLPPSAPPAGSRTSLSDAVQDRNRER
jgi:flagellar protein FlbD